VLIRGGLLYQEDQEWLEAVRWMLRLILSWVRKKKAVIREYVLCTACQCFSILSFSCTAITTGQSRVSPGTENISHRVFVLMYFNFMNKLYIFSFYLNTFQITLVTRLAFLKFRNSRHVISQAIYHTTRRPSEYHQWYTHHRLKITVLRSDRFAALSYNSKIISYLCNFLSYCEIGRQL